LKSLEDFNLQQWHQRLFIVSFTITHSSTRYCVLTSSFEEYLFIAFFATVALASNGSSVYTYQNQGAQAFSLALGLNTSNGDIHFNMSAPTTYSWLGFGIGGQMRNSLMFIGYPSSNGTGTHIFA
jgi:hypothetical protein